MSAFNSHRLLLVRYNIWRSFVIGTLIEFSIRAWRRWFAINLIILLDIGIGSFLRTIICQWVTFFVIREFSRAAILALIKLLSFVELFLLVEGICHIFEPLRWCRHRFYLSL